MSVKDFYNAVTPGSSLTHGVGQGLYTILKKDEVCSAKTYQDEKLPIERKGEASLLNEVNSRLLVFLARAPCSVFLGFNGVLLHS